MSAADKIMENIRFSKESIVAESVHALIGQVCNVNCRSRLLMDMDVITEECEEAQGYSSCIKTVNQIIKECLSHTHDIYPPIIHLNTELFESDKMDKVIQLFTPMGFKALLGHSPHAKKNKDSINHALFTLMEDVKESINTTEIEDVEMEFPITVFSRKSPEICIHIHNLSTSQRSFEGFEDGVLYDSSCDFVSKEIGRLAPIIKTIVHPPYESDDQEALYLVNIFPLQFLYAGFEDSSTSTPSLKRKNK